MQSVKSREELLARASDAYKLAASAQAEFVESLPVANEVEFAAVRAAVRAEEQNPEGLNVLYRLSVEQKAELKVAREERRAELADAKVRARYQRMAGSMALVSARLRVTKSGGDGKQKVKKSLTLRYVK